MHSKGTISTRRHQANEKAPHCWNSGRAGNEDATSNLRGILTTPDKSVQLPPLAADLEGLAVSLGVLAGNVSSEQWEFLKVFRANLCAAAERADAMENALEVPVPGPRLLYLAAPYSDPNPTIRLSRYHEANTAAAKLMAAGYGVISPLSMGVTITAACPNKLGTDWTTWKNTCLSMLACCSVVCVLPLPGWEKSIGVQAELEHARALGLAIRFVSFPAENQVAFTDSPERWKS